MRQFIPHRPTRGTTPTPTPPHKGEGNKNGKTEKSMKTVTVNGRSYNWPSAPLTHSLVEAQALSTALALSA